MAISFITSLINEALDNKLRVAGVFLGLAKTFDTVDHRILLRKCEFYGPRGVTLSLLLNYLQNRQQYVHLHGISSSKNCLNCGFPKVLYWVLLYFEFLLIICLILLMPYPELQILLTLVRVKHRSLCPYLRMIRR